MTSPDPAFLRRAAASIRYCDYGPIVNQYAEDQAARFDAQADELEAAERLAIDVGRVAIEASEGVAYGSKPDDFFHAAGEAVLGWLSLNGWKLHAASWGYGGGAAVYAPEARGKTREELLSEKVEQLQDQVKHLSRAAVNAAEHGIKAPSGSLKPCGYCHSTEATLLHACTNCGAMTSDPWSHPTSAEPAEEETKAEEVCTGSGGHHLYPCVLPDGHAGVHVDRRGLRWNSPASSPVVPAPTETGPWPSLSDVPAEVRKVIDANGDEWLRRSGVEWFGCAEGGITGVCRAGHPNLAPFNAVHMETKWQTWQEVPKGVKSVRDRTGQCWRYYPCIGWSCDFPGHRTRPMNDFAPFVAVGGAS